MDRARRLVALSFAASLVAVGTLSAQTRPMAVPRLPPPRPPAPEGHLIEVADGDTVIVDGDDRVRMLRRHHADVRVVADAQTRSILVLADWGTFDRPAPDGGVDQVWKFEGVGTGWPLDARWQGTITLLEPVPLRNALGPGADPLLLETPAGRVAFRAASDPTPADDRIVVTFTGMKAGGREGLSFEEAERDAASPGAMWSMSTMDFGRGAPGRSPFGGGAIAGVVAGAEVGLAGGVAPPSPPPVRPQPLRRVDPIWPDPSTMPGVQGVVTVLILVGSDGTVRDVMIRRGIPGLDAAALAAARQWRFVPGGPDRQPYEVSWPFPSPRR